MSFFLKKLIKFFFFYSIIITLLIVILNQIKSNFPYVYNSQNNVIININKINVGFFGDSHLMGGVDTYSFSKQTNKTSFSFSKGGRPLYFTSILIEKMLRINPKMEVVVSFGSNNASYNGSFNYLQDDLFSETAFKDYASLYSHLFNLNDIKNFISINLLKTLQSMIKSLLLNYDFFVFDGIDYNTSEYKKNYKKDIQVTKKKIKKSKTVNHIINYDFEYKRLLEVIRKFPESKFIIIRTPETKKALKIYPQVYHNKLTNKLKNYSNVNYRDFSRLELNVVEDFNDLTHLSKKGMKKFTDIFVNYYESVNNKLK